MMRAEPDLVVERGGASVTVCVSLYPSEHEPATSRERRATRKSADVKSHDRKLSPFRCLVVLIASPVFIVLAILLAYRPDRPIRHLAPGTSPEPAFMVQVIRPRAGLPLGGLLPPQVFGLEPSLGFDWTSPGASVVHASESKIELRADGWELVLVADAQGRVLPESQVVFDLEFEERLRRVRCRPEAPNSGVFTAAVLEDPSEVSGHFDIELPHCADAASGDSLGWPPRPLRLRGSFDRLPVTSSAQR